MSRNPSIFDKCFDWINKNVPVHSRAEYLDLLARHENVVWRLVTLEEQHRELCAAHHKVQEELARSVPMPVWEARGDAYYDIAQRETRLVLQWRIDPMRQQTAIADAEFMRGRLAFEDTIPAMHRFFMEHTAPALFEATVRNLSRDLGVIYENLRFTRKEAA